MFKAFIFDLDGTLIDSEQWHYLAYKQALQEYGINLTRENFINDWLDKGGGMQKTFREHQITTDPEAARKKKTHFFLANLPEKIPVLSGVIDFLKECQQEKIPYALASGSKKNEVQLLLEKSGLSPYFKIYLGTNDVASGKPAPDVFLLAAKKLKVKPQECLVFENAPNGLTGAKLAGMTCYILPSSFTKNCDFEKADKIITSFVGLHPLI